jgi:hypothetical protein
MNRHLPSVLLALTTLTAMPVHAVVFCAEDATELQVMLDAAMSNGSDDVIRLEAGIFRSTSALGFNAYNFSDDGTDLDIIGGWTGDCQLRLPNLRSTIDGELERPGLVLGGIEDVRGRLRILNLQFIRGLSLDPNDAGGLTINRGYDVVIESNVFRDNTHRNANGNASGGLYALTEGSLIVRNNLFFGNDADSPSSVATGAVSLHCYGAGSAGSFINNTVYDNTADLGAASDIGGVRLYGFASCPWSVANNNLWGNAGVDLALAVSSITLRNNNLDDTGGGELPVSSSGNINLSPQFVSATNLRPKRSSPLIDAGLNAPTGGLPGASFDGGPRLVGPRVDIGAYELDELLVDGFDPSGFTKNLP